MKSDTLRRIYNLCDRFLGTVLIVILLPQLSSLLPVLDDDMASLSENLLGGRYFAIVSMVIMFLLYYSVVRITTKYDVTIREKYAARSEAVGSFKGKLSLVLTWRRFWGELCAFILIIALLPPKWFSIGLSVLLGEESANLKLKYLLILVPSFIALNLLARLSTLKFFTSGGYQKTEFETDKAADKEYASEMIRALIPYAVGSAALCFVLPALLVMLPAFKELVTVGNIILLCIVIAALFSAKYVRAWSKRRKFIKDLKSICRERGLECSGVKDPYRSVFKVCSDGESFTVTAASGRKYSCKLISVIKKTSPFYVAYNGSCTVVHPFYIIKKQLTLFQYESAYLFRYESDLPKIVIINPTPNQIFSISQDKRVSEIASGDKVGDYKVFTATAFLNALERDVLEK